jgi:hypothetical protein
MSLIDPSKITPRGGLIVSVVLIIAFWLWHDYIVLPGRMIDQLCERAGDLEPDKNSKDVLNEIAQICRDRRPIIEGP